MATIVLPSPPPDASATVKGIVNLTAQTFAGVKTFQDGISVAGSIGLANYTFSGDTLNLNHAGTMTFGGTAVGINIASSIAGVQILGNTTLYPGTTNTGALGSGSNVWGSLYATALHGNSLDTLTGTTLNIGTGLANAIGVGSGSTSFLDSGGSVSIFNVTSLGLAFTFQGANTPGFKFTTDATAGVGNRIVEIDGFANQTVAPFLVKLGATPGGNGDALELQDSTGYQKWRTDILGGMMLNADASTAGSTLKSTAGITFQNHYWSTTDHTYQISFQGIMDTVAPTAHLQLSMGGNTKYTWDQKGLFTARAVQTQQDSVSSTAGQVKALDVNGNLRSGCDSMGLPSLGSYHYQSQCFGSMGSTPVTSGFLGSTGWAIQVSGGGGAHAAGTVTFDTTSVIGMGLFIDPSATANNYSVVYNNNYPSLAADNSTVLVAEWSAMFTTQTSNVVAHMSLANSAQMAHPNGFGFWWPGSGNWQWYTDNGTTRTITACSVGVAPTANRFQRFRIEYYGSASPAGAKTVKLYIDGTLVQTITGASVVTPTGDGFEAGVQVIANGGTPYLVIAEYYEWYNLVASPFNPS